MPPVTNPALTAIEQVVTTLGAVNVAVPVVFATAMIIRDLWKRARPSDPDITDAQIIDTMERKFVTIGQKADVEIERLRQRLS